MKIWILALTMAFPLWADNIESLDRRQAELGEAYEQLMQEIPAPLDLALSAINPAERDKVKSVLAKIELFFKQYDDFNLDKIDAFHDIALARAQEEVVKLGKNRRKIPRKVSKALKKFIESVETYRERKIFFGTERDTERLDVAHDVLSNYGNFAKKLRKSRKEKPWRNFGRPKLMAFIDRPKDILKQTDRILRLLWNAYFRTRTGVPDRAPIAEALSGYQRRLVKIRGVETKWEGLENIGDISHDGETLHMFLINHANSFYDSSAQQAFPVEGMSAMGDMDIFFPGFLAKRIAKSDHMIAVGHGDTTGKAIGLVRRRQLNRFFLAIEGITGSGLYEMRPVMPLFNEAVYDSIRRGLKLKLHPVAFPDNFRLLNDWRSPIEGPKVARGVLLPAIDNEVCMGLLAATGKMDSIGTLIRWMWFAALNNTDEETLAMPWPTTIRKNLEGMIWEGL